MKPLVKLTQTRRKFRLNTNIIKIIPSLNMDKYYNLAVHVDHQITCSQPKPKTNATTDSKWGMGKFSASNNAIG